MVAKGTLLANFVKDLNKIYRKNITFLIDMTEDGLPCKISIRYVAIKYRKCYFRENWERLHHIIDVKSHGTMFITTSEALFERGIIDLAVACKNHNYKESNIAETLKWLSRSFFALP